MKGVFKYLSKAGMMFAVAGMCLLFVGPIKAQAGVVEPNPETNLSDKKNAYNDRKAIQEELNATGYVQLVSGKTYYLPFGIGVKSGDKIDATGATIYCAGRILVQRDRNGGVEASNIDYGTLDGVTVTGGTWLIADGCKYGGSSIQFAYAKNLTFKDMTIKHAQGEYHTMELVACSNVLIDGCTIEPVSNSKSWSVEEQIQIDQATPNLAAFIPKSLQNGSTCSNVTINNCTVTGGRAVCANIDTRSANGKNMDNAKFLNKYHKNITVTNCHLTGTTTEALMLFNTAGITVSGNEIICKVNTKNSSKKWFTPGLHIKIYGKGKDGYTKNRNVTITNNTIKGGLYAVLAEANGKTKFGKVTFTNNMCYSKQYKKKKLGAYQIFPYKKLTKKGTKEFKG